MNIRYDVALNAREICGERFEEIDRYWGKSGLDLKLKKKTSWLYSSESLKTGV